MREITVVNTSPLFYLHRVGLFALFKQLYGHITVPQAVRDELEEGRAQGYDVPRLESYPWVGVESVSMPSYLQLIADLGPGESEVLALAANNATARVILDDRLARRIAEMQGFRLTGTAGVLLRARREGLVPQLKPLLESLIDLDFRLKPELLKEILELAGEG